MTDEDPTYLQRNPFSTINPIESSQTLLDLAFSKAMKLRPPVIKRASKLEFLCEYEKNRVNTSANVLTDRLVRIVNQFPSLNMIHPFYVELADILIGLDKIKKALGRIYGTIEVVRIIAGKLIIEMGSKKKRDEVKRGRTIAFGRLSGAIYRIVKELKLLEETRCKLNELPGFDPLKPCVVIAGVPNVGKSSFVSAISSGKPKIAKYPFTTKRLIFGHTFFGFLQVQFCDTPGLLDRPLQEKNKIELQAIAALKHISDIIVVLIDPTPGAITSIEKQLKLSKEFFNFYPLAEKMVIINKSDLISEDDRNKIVRFCSNKLQELGIHENSTEEVQIVTSINKASLQKVIRNIDEILKYKILKTEKFRQLTIPKIAADQLLLEEYISKYAIQI